MKEISIGKRNGNGNGDTMDARHLQHPVRKLEIDSSSHYGVCTDYSLERAERNFERRMGITR